MDSATAEMVAMTAWPGIRTTAHGPWRHRFSNGYTNRANSTTVLSWADDGDVDEGIDWGIARAEADGAAPVFQISDRREFAPVAAALSKRGFGEASPTVVMTRADPSFGKRLLRNDSVDMVNGAAGEWFDAWWGLTGGSAVGERVVRAYMARLPGEVTGALVRHEDTAVAVGLGIVVESGVYICSMETDPHHRRQGHASAIVSELVAAANVPAVLAVEADNRAARAAYVGLGFAEVGGYRYYR